jgi:phosphoribosylformylglycinamidine synthase subunit PurQ / glutaminase
MAQPRVLILRAPGTNCDVETAYAFELAGAIAERLHVRRLLDEPSRLAQFQILCIPGGFSYGDDVAAGRILGMQIQHHLADVVQQFRNDAKLILGICNGFQVLIKSGVLLDDDPKQGPSATLAWNDSGRYEDRWVNLAVDGNRCVFLRGASSMYLPIAHAEGKFVTRDVASLRLLGLGGRLVLRYARPGAAKQLDSPLPFPENPNGSVANVAGICDSTGRVFGLMPHPERHVDPTQHPRWTRGEAGPVGDGLQIFKNAVGYFA